MITEDYVSFETAKLLKERGFDEACECFYDTENYVDIVTGWIDISNSQLEEREFVCYSAPTLQMTMKWLRNIHNILIIPDYNYECTDKSYCYKIYKLGENGKPERVPIEGVRYDTLGEPHTEVIAYRDYKKSYFDYKTFEEACETAIRYCLEILI